jgi:hypothetical protein
MRILLWNVHSSWMAAFVQGPHTYLVPTLPGGGPDGRGRARIGCWPSSVREVSPEKAHETEIDLMVLQRPSELEHLAEAWTGRRPGRDVPAVYVEHNPPEVPVSAAWHPAVAEPRVVIVHVTHFNRLFWRNGPNRTVVIEPGIVDPGYRYGGALARAAFVANEPAGRERFAGTDLIPLFEKVAPVDVFRTESGAFAGTELTQAGLHRALPERRVYLHLARWTSLGLGLIEAMYLGLPVLALATTEVAEAVPLDAGVVSNDLTRLADAYSYLTADHDAARAMGQIGRAGVLRRYGLERFLHEWDGLLKEVTS